MSQTEHEKVLDKVKKLLALGESPNESEASLAISKAHELLKQYNLSMSDIKIEQSDIVDEVFITQDGISSWKVGLINHVAKLNYCELYRSKTLKMDGSYEATFNLVGKQHNTIVCHHMTEYLLATLDRMGKSLSGYGRNAIESYKSGLADTIMTRIQNMMKEDEVESVESSALVVQEKANIDQYFEDLKNNGSSLSKYTVPKKDNKDWDLYAKGRREGHHVSLNTQIGGSASDKVYIEER